MRRIFAKKTFIALAGAVLCVILAAGPVFAAAGTVTGNTVNVRSGPGTSNKVLYTLQKGERPEIIETLDGWYKIKTSKGEGYIVSEYFTPDPPQEATGTVTGNVVNLRSGPGTTYQVVGQAKKDAKLTVLAKSGDWFKVRQSEGTAYIIKTYFSLASGPSVPDEAEAVTGRGVVTGTVVNLRSGPGTNHSIVGQLKKGDEADITGLSNGWYSISAGGKAAYISASYLEKKTDSVPAEPVERKGVVTGSVVNLRSGPGTNRSVLAQLKKGAELTVTGTEGDWLKVRTAGGTAGYIAAEYVEISPESDPGTPGSYQVTEMKESGKVEGSIVNVRSAPFESADVIAQLAKGTAVEITGHVNNEWYRIKRGSYTGFMSTKYVAVGAVDIPEEQKTLGEKISEHAKKYIGIPYVYGGSTPATGFDCSGFTKYVFAQFGITIPRLAQYNAGTRVDRDKLLPGDLVFFNTQGSGIGHVGLYIGGGQFIHAPSPGSSVCITRMDSSYYSTRFVCATRILGN